MKYISLILLFFGVLYSCSDEKKINDAILNVPVKFEVQRFDEQFAKATPENLQSLKQSYPYLFPESFHDSIWVQKMEDTLQQELETEVNLKFADFSPYEADLDLLFKHLKFYFSDFNEPKIITLISDVDYRNKVIYADSLLLVGLDNFLGSDHPFYVELNKYISKNLRPEQLIPEITEAIAQNYIAPPSNRTFLDQMVYAGKMIYLKEQLLPNYEAKEVMEYTDEELKWARENETEIWRYFIEHELLYSTDPKLASRFILPGPFSKFYLELDNESPSRLGQYIGWKIVKAYAENNNTELKTLLQTPAETLFKQSKFKPRK